MSKDEGTGIAGAMDYRPKHDEGMWVCDKCGRPHYTPALVAAGRGHIYNECEECVNGRTGV